MCRRRGETKHDLWGDENRPSNDASFSPQWPSTLQEAHMYVSSSCAPDTAPIGPMSFDFFCATLSFLAGRTKGEADWKMEPR